MHTETPNLVGKTPDAAASLAGPDFAAVQVGHTRVTNEPKGTIISQDPRPGESVPKGTIIWVDVSAGRPEDPCDILE